MDKIIANWQGARARLFEIEVMEGGVELRSQWTSSSLREVVDAVFMTRDDLLAVIAGLKNALAELDGYNE